MTEKIINMQEWERAKFERRAEDFLSRFKPDQVLRMWKDLKEMLPDGQLARDVEK